MAEPFVGEIRAFSFGKAPRGWLLCDGSTLPINQYQALFSLLGITFGGDGKTNFKLPDLRGRTPVNINLLSPLVQGTAAGAEAVTLTAAQMPQHTHVMNAANQAATFSVMSSPCYLGVTAGGSAYAGAAGNLTALDPSTVTMAGAGAPHSNMQPSQVISYCIAVNGIYPTHP
ncbi:MAG TPA: tail fiber protein [Pseudomonadales bacterium]|nr:tail fiber protein [Pseudomonadales bacterium]